MPDALNPDITSWTQVINPSTGKPFDTESDYNAWSAGQSGAAAQSGLGAGYASDQASKASQWNSQSPASSTKGAHGDSNWTWTPQGNVKETGYTDPGTNSYVYQESAGGQGNPLLTINPIDNTIMYRGSSSGSQQRFVYDPSQDYGLGSAALGVIPLTTDAGGNPTSFYAGTGTGTGSKFTKLEDAITQAQAYKTWYDQKNPQGTPKSISPSTQTFDQWLAANPTASAADKAAGTSPAATTANGLLTTPGQGENQFDSTKGVYTDPNKYGDAALANKPTSTTNAQNNWNAYSGQYQNPATESSQNWDAQKGAYADPNTASSDLWKQQKGNFADNKTASSDFWNQWKDQLSTPEALKGVYDRQLAAAQTTLDRKAASAGWGDSAAAARATGNLGQKFTDAYVTAAADQAAKAGQLASASDSSQIAKGTLGLNLATGSDTSMNTKALTGNQLAGQADSTMNTKAQTATTMAKAADDANNGQTNTFTNQLIASTGMDAQRISGTTAGQLAADNAQTLGQNRLTGGFDRSLETAQSMSQLTSAGLSPADADSMSTSMTSLQLQLSQTNMTYAQATAKLNEYAAAAGVVGKSLTALMDVWAKNNGKSTSSSSSVGTNQDGTPIKGLST
jgi:hypothetical protein